jgi:hypothetical protein
MIDKELESVANTIKEIVEKQLAPAVVTEIVLESDIDHDGDPILRVQVIFEADDDQLDPAKVKGLTRHLREPLDNFANVGFPVLNFTSKRELPPEAA